ncbi:Adenylate and Guanylate cyclase catalytic domain [Phytophthora infestans]|uniref:Adenylate and Guanylate cyclase catalytic domain n=1 Tax=Phytophthora infestans TaxID=4787 RepID=A0A833SV74_PHYIN|nr:Adenylate and Guanylate cyclase catalytic domain [Phytophthora infestans]KAF4144173.1 Adenylate and Guanylate cyclase catalytic domain [Phytophthora infestans]
MIWAVLCITALALSAVGTALLVFKLYRDWDVRASSVQWLFAIFFIYQCIGAAARLVYFIWLAVYTTQTADTDDDIGGTNLVGTELYQLGTSAVLKLRDQQSGWVTAAITVGDTTHFGLAIWMFLLVYELSKLVAVSMDRGDQHERAKIRVYAWVGHLLILLFLAADIALAVVFSGYSSYAYIMLLSVYVLQTIALVYMIVTVVFLRVKGRNYESVHGNFEASPLYRRLKWIMLVYALFVFQFYFSSVVMYAAPSKTMRLSSYAGASFVFYYLRGFALSIVTGCSQLCVVRSVRCCVPDDIKARFRLRRDCTPLPRGSDVPYTNPVFVFTDIESSSALWAIGDGRIMQEATQLHDDILRGSLAPYRGYEITTAGDSFQLAFHTIQDAVEYCLEVQLHLLNAKWPKHLHGLVPATRKVRVGTRTIFHGLRVRMGVHDAVSSEGSLVRDVHAVTGKLIYTGASEAIANELGDLGTGGQILVTKRIAEWLTDNSTRLAVKFVVRPMGEYPIPRLHTTLEVFQVVPKSLAARLESFHPQHVVDIEREELRLGTETQTHYMCIQTPTGDRSGLYDISEEGSC